MSNSKPCNMHYNNTGILQTFFNPVRAQHTTDTALVQFHALLLFYYFLSIRAPYIYFSVFSICPSLSMLHHLMSVHPSITLSLYFTPFRGCTVPFPPWIWSAPWHHPPLSVSAGITFFASYLMSQWCNYRCRHFRNTIGYLGHFTAYSVLCSRLAWDQGGKTNTSGIHRLPKDCDSQLMY